MHRKRHLFAATLALAICTIHTTATATEPVVWRGFYSASPALAPTPPEPRRVSRQALCIPAILAAQERYQIPNNLLLAIGVQEAGRRVNGQLTIWPWTANYHGNGAYFDSKKALEDWVRVKQSQDIRSIDVGCMQVNQKWHAAEFASLEQATDPVANADYAARFLRKLYRETGNWWEAAGRYHSSNPKFKEVYLAKLTKNQQAANTIMANRTTLAVQSPQTETPAPTNGSSRPAPIIGWSADMTGAAQGRRFNQISIYSNAPLQPFMPQAAENN